MKKLFLTFLFVLLANTPRTMPVEIQPQETSPSAGMSQESAGAIRKITTEQALAPKPKKIVTPLDYAIPTPIISGKFEIEVCSSLPQTGEDGIMGEQIATGMQAFALKMKTMPEFNFYVKPDLRDDGSDVLKSRKNVATMNKKTPLFVSLFGSNIMKSLFPTLKQNKLVSIFPIEGLEKWRNEANINTVFFRASNKAMVTALIDYSLNFLHKKRFAVFYEASEWGDGIFDQIKKIIKERQESLKDPNIELVSWGSYPQKTVSVVRAVKNVSEGAPDSILCISQSRPAYYFIQQMIDNGFTKASFLCIDRLISIQETMQRSRGVVITTASVVPDPFKSMLQIVKEYREDMKKYFPNKELSPFSLEGYINLALLCECIKIAQFPISANKIMNTIEHIQVLNIPRLKDLNLSFDGQTRSIWHRVWINEGNNEKPDRDEWKEWLFNAERA